MGVEQKFCFASRNIVIILQIRKIIFLIMQLFY